MGSSFEASYINCIEYYIINNSHPAKQPNVLMNRSINWPKCSFDSASYWIFIVSNVHKTSHPWSSRPQL